MKVLVALLATLAGLAAAADARAGCGFYAAPLTASAGALINDADQVSLVRDGTRFALTMSTNYKGPAEDFAMIVPVPVVLKKEQVKTLAPAIFGHLEKLTAPRIVEYDEADPCPSNKDGLEGSQPGAVGAAPGGGGKGAGSGGGGYGVTVEAQFISGEYELVVLSASESDGLERWLRDNKYNVPAGASAALEPYVKQQQKFVIAKVDSKKVIRDANGAVVLSPLRFVYETQDFRLPVRLGLLNAPKGGKQDVIVYLLARGKRMESANLVNATIPTNVDVQPETVTAFPAFYAALFDATLARNKTATSVLEYAWSAGGCGAPCTDAPLTAAEISKLGGDEVFEKFDPQELVLTRLHTRIDAETLKEDIVFRAADPIAGGGEADPGAESKVSPVNVFQARYAVRNPWKGDIACAKPVRGNWVPSRSHQATDLASPKRDVQLAAHVVSPIPVLGIAGTSPGFGQLPEVVKNNRRKHDSPDEQPSITKPAMITVAVLAALTIAVLMFKRKRKS